MRNEDPWGESTRWSLVRRASGEDTDADLGRAWTELIERYREPVTRAVRRRVGRQVDPDEAAHDFFAFLLEKRILPKTDPREGRLRCYLQVVLRRYLWNYVKVSRSRESGLPSDWDVAAVPAEEASLERAEEADWAAGLLGRAARRLLEVRPRDGELLLRRYGVSPYDTAEETGALGTRFDLSANAVYVALHRARAALRDLLEEEIRETVVRDDEFESELAMTVERLLEARPGLLDSAS